MKYSLEEIKELILKEPSFYGWSYTEKEIMRAQEILEDALAHYEKLNKSNNGEGF